MKYRIRITQEPTGGFIARVAGLAGVLGFGPTRDEALSEAKRQARREIAQRTGREPTDPSIVLFTVEPEKPT